MQAPPFEHDTGPVVFNEIMKGFVHHIGIAGERTLLRGFNEQANWYSRKDIEHHQNRVVARASMN